VLPNAIPQVFQPTDRAQARAALGWPQAKQLILFGAIDATDPRKGADLLQAALRRLAPQDSEQLMAVILGQSQPKQPQDWPIPAFYSGRFHDDVSLALAYAAADVVVVPSRMDNLPQSATEAMACGTPVVAFDQGGMADVITHQQTGWLAQPFDPQALSQGIRWALQRPQWQPVVSQHLSRWRPDAVARAHADLYAEVLSR
jgi:glycosyltransferase involved in cell wall biosynthesis